MGAHRMPRRIIMMAVFFAFTVLHPASAHPVVCRGGLREVLRQIQEGVDGPFRHLSPEHAAQLENVIGRSLGEYLYRTGPNSPRICAAGKECVVFSGRQGEKDLVVRWESGISQAAIRVTPTTRELVIPAGWKQADLAAQGDGLLQRWTVGHSLHPFITDKRISQELESLGIYGYKLRTAQKEGAAAGISAFESGKSSFLYVAPTGTGKTEVIVGVLSHELRSSRNAGKFHLMVAHQNELVDQFAETLRPMAEAGQVRVFRELNVKEIVAASGDKPPPVIAMTIQGLTAALARLGPEEIKLLREHLGLMIFDEVHHLGGPTYLETTRQLVENNKGAKLLGTTATPVHRDEGITELFRKDFEGQSFWAYLDHGGAGAGIERTPKDVVDQLQGAIQAGELTPLEHFYVMDPKSLGSADDVFVKSGPGASARYQIDPARYDDVIQRISPLFDRHKSGFLAANSIHEAERLRDALRQALPNKKFEVFHGQLSNAERQAIINRMKSGENLFLVTVNLLDEGVNFPGMSLYIDLNRNIGVRQLLQRWGRVARLAPGKEDIEIAVLSAWDSADTIREKIDLIESVRDRADSFKGGVGKKPGEPADPLDAEIAAAGHQKAVDVPGLLPIDEATKRKELDVLITQARKMFEDTGKENPAQRLLAHWEKRKGLPTRGEEPSLYTWIYNLPADETRWPAMPEDLKTEIRKTRTGKRGYVRQEKTPLERITEQVKSGKGIPSATQDPAARQFIRHLDPDPSRWPAMDEEVMYAIMDAKMTPGRPGRRTPVNGVPNATARSGAKGPSKAEQAIQRLEDRLLANTGVPLTRAEDPDLYDFVAKLDPDPDKWPKMDGDVRKMLLEHKARMRKTAVVKPIGHDRVAAAEALVKAGKPLPKHKADNILIYQFLNGLPDDPDKWPAMSGALKDKIIEWKLSQT